MSPTSKEIIEAAKKLGVHPDSIRRRIRQGMDPAAALTTKPKALKKQRRWKWDHVFPAHHRQLREQGQKHE
jgi:hypothetical protein